MKQYRIETELNRSYETVYRIEISHDGLHKYRLIRGKDRAVVVQVAAAQEAQWEEMWAKRQSREQGVRDRESKADVAVRRTKEANDAVARLENTRKMALQGGTVADWDVLRDSSKFPTPKPRKPKPVVLEEAPLETHRKYQPAISIVDRIFPSRRQRKVDEARLLFTSDLEAWQCTKDATDKKNAELEAEHQEQVRRWEADERELYEEQKRKNEIVDGRKAAYRSGSADAVVDHCVLVLSRSAYPDYFPQEFDVDYSPETRILVANYSLPAVSALPRLKEVRYISSKDEFAEVELSDSVINRL